jgi:hypothetical protein
VPRPSARAAATTAVAALALSLLTAAPAVAKDAPTPAPAPAPLDCYGDPAIVAMTGPDIAVNYAGNAGCVGVRSSATSLRLAWVVLADGWSYVVKSDGGGTNSRVQLQFTQASTGERVDFRYEFGKTVIG